MRASQRQSALERSGKRQIFAGLVMLVIVAPVAATVGAYYGVQFNVFALVTLLGGYLIGGGVQAWSIARGRS